MGSMLNMARAIFIDTPIASILTTGSMIKALFMVSIFRVILKRRAQISARIILLVGPEMATHIIPLRGFLKLRGLTGTGLAQPTILVTAKTSVPTGSRWAIGFRVSLPMFLAVGSPNR